MNTRTRAADLRAEAERLEEQARKTPEDIAVERAEFQAIDKANRERIRASVDQPVELTLDSLLARLGFSREFAEHFVQPYCGCFAEDGGWVGCSHAYDLGIGSP